MKRNQKRKLKITYINTLIIFISLIICHIHGVYAYDNKEIIIINDTDYIEVVLYENTNKTLLNINTITATSNKTYKKKYTYVSSNKSRWQAILTGTFNPKQSYTCVSSSISTSIIDKQWTIKSKSASKSGRKASGHVVASKDNNEKTCNLSITCNSNGPII